MTLTSFCAEGGLKRLLGIKGRTGLNTDLFGELNCRLGTNTVTMNILAGILKERMVPLGNVQVSEIDKMFATRVNENYCGYDLEMMGTTQQNDKSLHRHAPNTNRSLGY